MSEEILLQPTMHRPIDLGTRVIFKLHNTLGFEYGNVIGISSLGPFFM